MAAVPYAHVVAKMLKGKHPKGTSIELAPNPKDIVRYWFIQPLTKTYDLVQIWENMNKSDIEIARKKAIGFWFLALVCFFNTVPLFVISVLANLTAVRGLSDCMRTLLKRHSWRYTSHSLMTGLWLRPLRSLSYPVYCHRLFRAFLDSSFRLSCAG